MEISLFLSLSLFFSTYARLRFVFSSTIYDYNYYYLLKKREREKKEFELNNDLKYVVKSIGIAYYY